MEYKTIKEVIDLTGITANALRYYHEKGIAGPSLRRADGRREWLYDQDDIERLNLVMRYREIDLSVKEIKQILDGCEDWEQIVSSRLEALIAEKELIDQRINLAQELLKKGV